MNYSYIFESSCPGGRIAYADTNVIMYSFGFLTTEFSKNVEMVIHSKNIL